MSDHTGLPDAAALYVDVQLTPTDAVNIARAAELSEVAADALARCGMEAATDPVPETPTETAALAVPCEVYSRIVGYIRPVSAWNAGKRQEFDERKVFEW